MAVVHPAQSDEPISRKRLPLLYNVVYCSRATAGVDDAAVTRIIASSRRNNPRHAITGLLVFGSGIFFQLLEGPRDSVTELMTMIRSDARHDNIVVLNEAEEAGERLFPNWDMELVTTDDIRAVLQDAMSTASGAKTVEALRVLIEHLDSGSLSSLNGS